MIWVHSPRVGEWLPSMQHTQRYHPISFHRNPVIPLITSFLESAYLNTHTNPWCGRLDYVEYSKYAASAYLLCFIPVTLPVKKGSLGIVRILQWSAHVSKVCPKCWVSQFDPLQLTFKNGIRFAFNEPFFVLVGDCVIIHYGGGKKYGRQYLEQ